MERKKFRVTFCSFGLLFLTFIHLFVQGLLALPDGYHGGKMDHFDHHHYDASEHHQDDGPMSGYGNSNLNNGNCRLPDTWKGKWFQSGLDLQPVTIDNKSIGTKGVCIESSEDKYLFYDPTLNCHKCLVINERHRNVLQYKESPDCNEKDLLENLCQSINGDAQLYSLFRLDAQPEECPFRGAPFNFTYNRGHGECKDPVSRVDSCTESSRLLLRFEACPNVEKTESKLEELECLGQWKDGSNHYLMGKIDSRIGSFNYEEKYRCFIFERIKGHEGNGHSPTIGWRVAQSGDATCTGVQSATEGARALTLMKIEQGASGKCKFPNWVSSHHWHTLDGKISIKMHHHKNTTLHIVEDMKRMSNSSHYSNLASSTSIHGTYSYRSPYNLFNGGSRILCQSRQDISSSHISIVAHHVEGCKSETVCLNIFKRDSHVIELKMTRRSSHADGDCSLPSDESPPNSSSSGGYVTLVSGSAPAHRCPNLGKYLASGVSEDGRGVREACGPTGGASFNSVIVGCGDRGTMEFHSKCATQEPITSYTCHGSWREGETGYLIASPLQSRSSSPPGRRFCFIYTEGETGGLRVSSSSESCRRNISPGVEGSWAFNLTNHGQCAERLTSGALSRTSSSTFSLISVILLHPIYLVFSILSSWRTERGLRR